MTQVQPAEPATIPAAPDAAARGTGSRIVALDCYDVRFPTSLEHDGSDAMNPDPDYSAAYAVLRTDAEDLAGEALCFTIGRGNDVVVAAIAALRQHVVGKYVADIVGDLGAFSASMIGDSQLRWLGPEKGVMHMAIGTVVNAAWDLAAKVAGKPVWRLLADMTPEEIVALVDFRYLEDALTPDEALGILRAAQAGKAERIAPLESKGHPAYTTTPGWIGYSDEKLAALSRQAVADGFTQIKLKVGADVDDDVRRLALAREVVGPDIRIAVDANQRWGVAQAAVVDRRARPVQPLLGRGADEPGRDPRPRRDQDGDRAARVGSGFPGAAGSRHRVRGQPELCRAQPGPAAAARGVRPGVPGLPGGA